MNIPEGSKSFKHRNPHLFSPHKVEAAPLPTGFIMSPKTRIRQSQKPLLNKLETDFAVQILAKYHPNAKIRAQSMTLVIGNGVRYTPDFFVFDEGVMIAYEVKGPVFRDDAAVKLKVAARCWTEISFNLAWKDNQLGWRSQMILP